nr:hypothetical protein CFP56_52738 [Quercus suber]
MIEQALTYRWHQFSVDLFPCPPKNFGKATRVDRCKVPMATCFDSINLDLYVNRTSVQKVKVNGKNAFPTSALDDVFDDMSMRDFGPNTPNTNFFHANTRIRGAAVS